MVHEINRLVGTRFKISKLGAARCPALAGQTGSVVEVSHRNTGVTVLFDGAHRPTCLHRDFITLIAGNGLWSDPSAAGSASNGPAPSWAFKK